MNDLVRRAANGAPVVPAVLPVPPMPTQVEAFARQWDDHDADQARFDAATPEQREDMFVQYPVAPVLSHQGCLEAARAAKALDVELRPIQPETLATWAGVINASVRNPQSQQDFGIRCQGLWEMLNDLPEGAFTAEARRALAVGFFPSAPDIRAAVEPGANRLRRLRGLLDRALEASKPREREAAQAHVPPTMVEVLAVRQKLAAAFRPAAPSRALVDSASRPQAKIMGDRDLLAMYERSAAEGNAAAAARAKALRAKLEDAQ